MTPTRPGWLARELDGAPDERAGPVELAGTGRVATGARAGTEAAGADGAGAGSACRQARSASRSSMAVWKRSAGLWRMARMMTRSVASLSAGLKRRNRPGVGVSSGSGSVLVSTWYIVAPRL